MTNLTQHFEGLDPARSAKVEVLVLTGYGLNCEAETVAGFEMLGCSVTAAHVGDLIADEDDASAPLDRAHILAFIGGFSFGDHVASGRVYANRLRHRLGTPLEAFVDRGGLAIGMCNGFQTMAKLGILPALDRESGQSLATPQASLVDNARRGYRDAWVQMVADPESPCVWTRGPYPVEVIDCPSRHAEGRLIFADEATQARIEAAHLVPLRYCDGEGRATEQWPHNPNGSSGGAAALCDRSGRLFGLMPHPEAYLYAENHPRWIAQRDAGTLPATGAGLSILANGVRAAIDAFGL